MRRLPRTAQERVVPPIIQSLFQHTAAMSASAGIAATPLAPWMRASILKLVTGVLTKLAPGVSDVALAPLGEVVGGSSSTGAFPYNP